MLRVRWRLGAGLALTLVALFLMAASASQVEAAPPPGSALTYDQPATRWTEALPIGNGRLGAMVFGGTEDERLQVNEGTLWGGGPHDYTNPGASAHLDEIRRLIFAGKVGEAEKLADAVMGRPKLLMPYQPFCDVRMHFPGHGQATAYRRELRLDDATVETRYTVGATEFRREVFASFPAQVLVLRLTASRPGQLDFSIGMDSPQQGTRVESTAPGALQLTGQIQPRQNPARSWTGSWDEPGLRFAAVLQVLTEGGSVRGAGSTLAISGANAVTIVFSGATSFRTYRDIGGDALGRAREILTRASAQPYDRLRRAHLDDFSGLFSRVQLRLGEESSTETTDRRIKRFAETEDPSLLALYHAFGRYLLISSSRPGGQPANLQGIWNEELLPAWSSKWTTNINLEMNYWPADTADLWETQEPLWQLIRGLRETGAETARAHYGAQGWVLHHNTDLWRATTPVDGAWGLWPMGQVWLANQMWDHYEFSGDRAFLRQHAYPAMKEAAQFVLGTLVTAPDGTRFAGRLVTNPSTSPENQYILNGVRAHLTYAATMDIELVRELFGNCARAAEELGADAGFRAELRRTAERLPPLQVGARGQLQEWIEDYPEAEPAHRHVSHLYALFPGHGISLEATPELAAAARKTLELRGDGGTGWAAAWKVALWARLRDAEHAYDNVKFLMTRSTLPNMFDLHPPFQIDGNLGATAGITEMLVQSTATGIRVLPALPQRWTAGSLKGVRVRGGAQVDITWKDGRLAELRLRSGRAKTYTVAYGERRATVRVGPGTEVVLDGTLGRITR
jgi:alpha-L-fucosidase 2